VDRAQIPTLNTIRIIVAALFLGVASFTGVLVALNLGGSMKPSGSPIQPEIFAAIVGALAFGAAIALPVIPNAIIRQNAVRYRAATTEDEKRAVALQTLSISTIIKCALVEGVGLFGAVVFMLTGMWPILAAPVLAALVILSFLPSEGKIALLRERLDRAASS
jgi:hypothetical protein